MDEICDGLTDSSNPDAMPRPHTHSLYKPPYKSLTPSGLVSGLFVLCPYMCTVQDPDAMGCGVNLTIPITNEMKTT